MFQMSLEYEYKYPRTSLIEDELNESTHHTISTNFSLDKDQDFEEEHLYEDFPEELYNNIEMFMDDEGLFITTYQEITIFKPAVQLQKLPPFGSLKKGKSREDCLTMPSILFKRSNSTDGTSNFKHL